MSSAAPLPSVDCDPLDDFIRHVAPICGVEIDDLERLCARIGVPRDVTDWRSTLNNDGSPVQICIGLRALGTKPGVRVIADPYREGDDRPSRAVQSRAALRRLAEWHAPDMARPCDALLARMTPSGCGLPYPVAGGDTWFAAGVGGLGVAIYATARWGDPASRWSRALAWLDEIAPAARSIAMLSTLAAHATLISVGVEGHGLADARVKFYWRPNGSAPLSQLGMPLLQHPALPAFLTNATEGMTTAASAIVGSVGIELATGSIADVKLDLCGHCVPRSTADWGRRIDYQARRHGLTPLPLAALEPDAPVEVAFIGLGIDHDLQPRMNVYLKPVIRGGRR